MLLSLVPDYFLRFFALNFRTARHLFVRAFPICSIRIHWMPSAALSVHAAWGVLILNKFQSRISLTIFGICVAHSSACHPSSIRSQISFLSSSSRFARGGGLAVITSYHHSQMCALFPKFLVFFVSHSSREENSISACSSSSWMAASISLIVSREISIRIRDVTVSSVLNFPLHCSSSSAVLEIVWNMVSFTFRSPTGEP